MREQLTNATATAAATLAESIDSANERALTAVIDANRRFVDLAVTAADRFTEQVSFDLPFQLPFADRLPALPTPAESGERYLDFVERAVAVNREFNDRIVALLTADTTTVDTLIAKVTDQATDAVATATTSARTTTAKAGARTTTARKAATRRAGTAATAAKSAAKRTAKTAASKAAAPKTPAKPRAKRASKAAAAS